MKKLLMLLLCLCLLAGCTLPPLPFRLPDLPFFGSHGDGAPTASSQSPSVEAPAAPLTTPAPTATPAPAEATSIPDQDYAGACLRFQVPGSWHGAQTGEGVYFFPRADDRSTFLLYQEVDNEMQLTEATVDMALLFSSDKAIASLVESVLRNNGMDNVKLSSVSVKKDALNGLSCYTGAATVTLEGASYDFTGHIFLRRDKFCLLIWVGDETAYAAQLNAVYASVQAVE